MMNKRKTVFIAVVVGTGIMAVIDRIRLHSNVNDLEERTKDIGRCHNDFCLQQDKWNLQTDHQLSDIIDEMGSVYEHIEELSKGREDGR